METLAPTTVSGALSPADLQRFHQGFDALPAYRQAMNAVTATPVTKVALDRRQATKIDHSFSVHLKELPATSQKASGRCWMFAALNTFRARAQASLNVETFEFSQAYVHFWDKLEKSNYFLESILQTLDEPIGSRLLDWLLANALVDGGQWDMFVNLVQKYGAVPKGVMPETDSSSNTGSMNFQVLQMLRDGACRLRQMASEGLSEAELRAEKDERMAAIYRMLTIHLGEPPERFEWQWRDKDRQFHRDGSITPQEFWAKHVGVDLDDYVCLIHDPRPDHPLGQTYTVRFLGNVVGGKPTEYLNTDLETIKRAAIAQLESGDSVWFGCDVGKYLERDLGVMDVDLFRFDLVYGTKPSMTKAERLQYGHSLMTHAMTFTGVDLDEAGRSRKWRVENSWSDAPGDKGYFQMSDPWFDEFLYEVVVHRSHVPAELLAAREQAPIVLDPWDPMGSLA